jgi:rRNA-processing protein FCF1
MLKIVLDTNFLMSVFELKIDIFSEFDRILDEKYELFVLEGGLRELEKFINEPGFSTRKRVAKSVVDLLSKRKDIKTLKSETDYVDDALAELQGYVIATVDKELKKRVIQKGEKLITIRQSRHLVMK